MTLTPGASTQNNGNTSTVVLPVPAHGAGDLLLAWFESTGQAVSTVPAGWTLAGTTSTRGSLYTRFDTDGSLTADQVWGLTASNRWAGTMLAVAGVDPAIWDLGAPNIVGATTNSLVVPSITPPSAGTLLVSGFANSSPAVSATVPSGWVAAQTVTSSGYVVLATKAGPAAGSPTGDVTWAQSSSRACGAFLGALRPASGGGTTTTTTATLPVTVGQGAAAGTTGTSKVAAGVAAALTATALTIGGTTTPVPAQVGLSVAARTEAAVQAPAPLSVGLAPVGSTSAAQALSLPLGASLTPRGATEGTTGAVAGVGAAFGAAAATQGATGAAVPVGADLAPAAATVAASAVAVPLGVGTAPVGSTQGTASPAVGVAVGVDVAASTVVAGSTAAITRVGVDLVTVAATVADAATTTPVAVHLDSAAATTGAAAPPVPVGIALVVAASTTEPDQPATTAALPVTVSLDVTARTEGRTATSLPILVGLFPAVTGQAPPSTGRLANTAAHTPAVEGAPFAATLAGWAHAGSLAGTALVPTISGAAAVDFKRTDRKPILWDASVVDADPTGAVATIVVGGQSYPMTITRSVRTAGGWLVQAVTQGLFAGPDAAGAGATTLTLGEQTAVFTLTIGDTILTDPDTITVT